MCVTRGRREGGGKERGGGRERGREKGEREGRGERERERRSNLAWIEILRKIVLCTQTTANKIIKRSNMKEWQLPIEKQTNKNFITVKL